MTDTRESFPTLEGASQEGLALRAVQEGDAVAAKNGSIAVAFQDNSGNAILPTLDGSGNVPVSGPLTDTELRATAVPVSLTSTTITGSVAVTGPLTDTELRASPVPVVFGTVTGNGLKVRGTIAGNASLTTVASLTLAVNEVYENLDFIVSCFRDCRFQVILSDNGSETIIADALAGPGAFSFHANFGEMELATGSTGAQLLLIKGINLNALSDMYAAMSIKLA